LGFNPRWAGNAASGWDVISWQLPKYDSDGKTIDLNNVRNTLVLLANLMRKYSAINIVSLLSRREVLGFMSGTVAIWLFADLRRKATSEILAKSTAQAVATPACVVKPQQTEGPYFVDEKLNRSDIRSDPTDGLLKPGVPLRLVFQVSQASRNVCTPLKDAVIDVWHCDAEGAYSDVQDRSFSTAGKKFLRGYQVTNANGAAEFVTIYPGWYPGRTVHIHFKIRTHSAAQPGYEFTSQLYFEDVITDLVHAQAPYVAKGQRTQKNDQDGIFREGGEQLMLQLTQSAEGYEGRFNIGIESI
jgi:protocatechuate 3,4-dioxygenase beta subunit